MLGIASAAGGLAYNAASGYIFRGDASTSKNTSNGTAPTPPIPTSPSRSSRRAAHGPSSSASSSSSTSTNQRLSRPSHSRRQSHLPTASPSKRSSASAGPDSAEGIALVDSINKTDDLYAILGVGRKSKPEEIRRAFLGRSRLCHPDKLPDYAPATPAFQRLSYAYETLSKPPSRRMYDLGGGRSFDPGSPANASATMGDDTLNGVLRNVFTEFMSGDFEMIRVFVNALNDGSPGLNLGDETIDNLEGAFRRVREVVLSGQKYLRLIRFELIRLYQLQLDLRSLSYFDLVGRWRLTLALMRVTLEIPMVLDRAMREEEVVVRRPMHMGAAAGGQGDREEDNDDGARWENGEGGGELQRRGLLGPRVKGVLVLACKVLEKGEKFGL